jgi:cytoskeletal protein CcmA (bactofilin family)
MPDPRDSLVNSLIGAGSSVDGDIDIDGLLRIDGDVRGSVRVTGKIVVGAAGRVEASIRAQSAIIGGIVKGDVYVAERLRILSGGVVIGNVFAPRLEAEEGTVVHGDVAVTGRPAGIEAEMRAFVEAHGDARRFLGRFRAESFAPARPGAPRQAAGIAPIGIDAPARGDAVDEGAADQDVADQGVAEEISRSAGARPAPPAQSSVAAKPTRRRG